jgi:sulfite reductase (NADPH) hemoprotein beta-component
MCTALPELSSLHADVYRSAASVSEHLTPNTRAYHEIWLNQQKVADTGDSEPIYGDVYLPRKFKIAFAIPPTNDVDVFTNCLGFIAVIENDQLLGYNVAVGGGMGRSHGNEQTYPRLADVIGFISSGRLVDVAKAVLCVHRDFGDRMNRKHARLKYVVEERGADWVREEVEAIAGLKLEAARPFKFTTTGDLLGWHKATDDRWFLTLFVESGRVKHSEAWRLKTGLRRVAEQFPGVEFRLSPNQNLILAGVPENDKAGLTALLAEHGVPTERQASVLHLAAMACPALPTCGLALAEAERFMPGLLDRIEALAAEVGLAGEEIVIRMTGCPNGCARPYMAEIAFVGKAPGRYQIWLGGNAAGTRLNRIWNDMVKDADIEAELRPVLTRYAAERQVGERFGDWVERTLWKEHAASQ